MNEDTLKTQQLRNTTLPMHQKNERWGTYKDKTNVTFKTADAQTNKNYNRGTALERSIEPKKKILRA